MKIYDEIKFNKYLGHPVRVKRMFPDIAAIAEGALLASFKTIGFKEFERRNNPTIVLIYT